ncbi:MAG: hypothetical protein ABUL72_02640, partial [Armatimonadota bacterium]
MEEIRRRDTQVYVRRVFRGSLFVLALAWAVAIALNLGAHVLPFPITAVFVVVSAAWCFVHAYNRSIDNRFHDRRLLDQWKHCEDRVTRLNASLKEMRKANIADLTELPKNVDKICSDIYLALRRADLVMFDAAKSEGRLSKPQTVSLPATPDRQAQDLLRQADRNIAEYNSHMQKLLGTVQRTEAQVMVFITTLDSLRARMLNYKASPRTPDVDNQEFMTAIREAQMQFDAIDKALDELD